MRIIRAILGFACALLLLGSSCPMPEGPLPPTLGAPSLTSITLTYHYAVDTYHPATFIEWTAPNTDSIPVSSYTVIRKRLDNDSGFAVIIHSIPDSILHYYDLLDNSDLTPPALSDAGIQVIYRMIAIDSLGRESDTSNPVTLILTPRPVLEYPYPAGSLDTAHFTWQVPGHQGQTTNYMVIANQAGYFWQSHSQVIYSNEMPGVFEVIAPDTLASGNYQWIVFVFDTYAELYTVSGSIAMRQFYVP